MPYHLLSRVFLGVALALVPAVAAAQEPPPPAAARVETPNAALSFEIPADWTPRPLKSGVALEPPGNPLDETIVAACEPFSLPSIQDDIRLEDLLSRLRAGQLATMDQGRPQRTRIQVGSASAAVVTYRGTDDGGRPAALRIAVLPASGRVAILTARIPAAALEARSKDLDAIVASFAVVPVEEDKALAKRLAGAWRSDAAPRVALKLRANGTFEEVRSGDPGGSRAPSAASEGTWDVIGKEVRFKFDDGQSRAFKIDSEPGPGEFVSAGQTWKRTAE